MISYDSGMNLIISEYEKLYDSIREVRKKIKAIYEKINCQLENPEAENELKGNPDQMDVCNDKNNNVKNFL